MKICSYITFLVGLYINNGGFRRIFTPKLHARDRRDKKKKKTRPCSSRHFHVGIRIQNRNRINERIAIVYSLSSTYLKKFGEFFKSQSWGYTENVDECRFSRHLLSLCPGLSER